MTFAPELDLFRISIRETVSAYQSPYVDLSPSNMFQENVSIKPQKTEWSKLRVYPNPANEFISFNIDWNQFDYQIFDGSGREVLSGETSSKTINIEMLSNGTYYLLLRNNEKTLRTIFIVH